MSTILVIEDDPGTLEILTLTLVRARHEVRSHIDGPSALLGIDSPPADLVLLGWRIPFWEGFDFCRRLRAHSQYANTPIVMVSDQPTISDIQCGLLAGADDYITQPFSSRHTLRHINLALSEKQRTTKLAPASACTVS